MAKRIHSLLVALSLMTAAHPALAQSQYAAEAVTNVRGPLGERSLGVSVLKP